MTNFDNASLFPVIPVDFLLIGVHRPVLQSIMCLVVAVFVSSCKTTGWKINGFVEFSVVPLVILLSISV